VRFVTIVTGNSGWRLPNLRITLNQPNMMSTSHQGRNLVAAFIEEIWNQQHFQQAGHYLHADFKDHSLPPHFPAGPAGTIRWIQALGESFVHKTEVEDVVAQSDKVVLKIKLHLKHVGQWRDIDPTGAEVITAGYRLFRVERNKIIEQWALIDGESIEKSLKELPRSCMLLV
jgi:predicted SnoaL-like aldol condensation-catalyzing enzyme